MPDEFGIEALVAGWNASRSGLGDTVWSEALLSSSRVLDLAMVVEAPEEEALEPLLLWIPTWARIHWTSQESLRRVTVPVGRIASLNVRRRSLHRTIMLLKDVSGRHEPFSLACMLAALHGLRASGAAMPGWSGAAVRAICTRLGRDSVYSIWHYTGQDTLPLLKEFFPDLASTPYEFGRACGHFMSRVYQECFPARILPIRDQRRAGPPIHELQACLSRVAPRISEPYGNPAWRSLDRKTLEALVWSVPRLHLRRRFEVSDRAISKRCASWGISQPPRGFWQRLRRGKHPGDILEAAGVSPPPGVDLNAMIERMRNRETGEERSEPLPAKDLQTHGSATRGDAAGSRQKDVGRSFRGVRARRA